jgi:hypothetical protein
MYILLAALTIGCFAFAYTTYNLLMKVESLEDELNRNITVYETNLIDIRDQFIEAEIEIKQLDINGTFESDDEVGIVYKSIRAVINDLDRILKEYEKD